MTRTKPVLVAACISLAIAFTISCSSDGDGDGGIPNTCSGKQYNTTDYSCVRGEIVGSCKGVDYYPEYQHCDANGVVQDGAEDTFNDDGKNSDDGKVDSKLCNGKLYDPAMSVCIGIQIWMSKNLDVDVPGSKCFGEDGEVITGGNNGYIFRTLTHTEVQANCEKYGRLYDWATAMNLPSSCNSSTCSEQIPPEHRGICPEGWHIPSDAEWTTLINYVESQDNCTYCAGAKLKAKSYWNSNVNGYGTDVNGPGTDDYGFSALPGGMGRVGSWGTQFIVVGDDGYWWSSSEDDSDFAWTRFMYHKYIEVLRGNFNYYDNSKTLLLSVRCIKDDL